MALYKNLPRTPAYKKKDEFISAIDRALHWFAKYKNQSLVGVVFVLLLFLGSLLFNQRHETTLKNLSQSIFEAGQSDKQASALEAVLKQTGPVEAARFIPLDLYKYYLKDQKPDEALKALDQGVALAPDFLKPLLMATKAQTLWQQGKTDDALKVLDSIDVKEGYPRLVRAWILEGTDHRNEALVIYDELAKNSEKEPFVSGEAKTRALWLRMKQ